jgi:leucyl-tRNA synthetase
MSKSKKNVVDPQGLIERYGADTIRMFCLFASPPEKSLEWSDQGVEGSYRFLNRLWRLVDDNRESIIKGAPYSGEKPLSGQNRNLHRKIHQTIKKVSGDIENRFHFNTAIAAVMELVNEINQMLSNKDEINDLSWSIIIEGIEASVILLSPVVPHITEELWKILGHDKCLSQLSWPSYSEEALKADTKLVVLQVNGKVRSRIEIPASQGEEEIKAQALADERVKNFIGDKKIKKVIVVQNKLVNVVV